MPAAPASAANHDASEIYDRQIRLWGLEAQKRMQESKVLFCGMRALQAEICKNIILAGINVALLDHQVVTAQDLNAQFYLRPQNIGQNRAEACLPGVQEMNPLAKVECHTQAPSDLPDDFFQQFDVIVVSDLPPAQLLRIDHACRAKGKCFIYADSFALNGWAFVDLGKHTVRPEGVNEAAAADKVKENILDYPSLEEAFKAPWSSTADKRFPTPKVFVMARLLNTFEDQYGHRPSPFSKTHNFDNDVEKFVEMSTRAMSDNGLKADFLTQEELRDVARCGTLELSPVCAVLGGILGQEILKAISLKGEPAFNCFIWDGQTHEGRVIKVPK